MSDLEVLLYCSTPLLGLTSMHISHLTALMIHTPKSLMPPATPPHPSRLLPPTPPTRAHNRPLKPPHHTHHPRRQHPRSHRHTRSPPPPRTSCTTTRTHGVRLRTRARSRAPTARHRTRTAHSRARTAHSRARTPHLRHVRAGAGLRTRAARRRSKAGAAVFSAGRRQYRTRSAARGG